MDNILLQEAQSLAGELQEIIQTLHKNPELSGKEYMTSAFIKGELEKLGIEAVSIADTGVMGVIRGGKPGKTVSFRADMDALPVQEETGLPYASQVPGKMHACGHDFHMTTLLGAARLLMNRREELCGNVKLFFQPDEEVSGGAERMILAGCMEDPHVDAVFGCHVDSSIPTGSILVRSGVVCAAPNPFSVTFRGKGTHGAKPHLGTDVIVAACQTVMALQTISSRRCSPTEPVIVTIGAIHSGTAGNVIPGEARIDGTIRTMGGDAQVRVQNDVRSIVTATAAAMGVEAEVEITPCYPCCDNDKEMVQLVRSAAGKVLGEDKVFELAEPSMCADDFGYFSNAVPGCYYLVGVGNEEKNCTYPIHNPRFSADHDALPYAAAVYAQIALDYLEQ